MGLFTWKTGKIGPVPKGPLSRDIHVLLIVTLGRLGAAITGDNAPRAVEEGLSIDEQGKRTTSVVHRSMTATDGRQAAWAAKRYRSHRTIPPEAILDAPTE